MSRLVRFEQSLKAVRIAGSEPSVVESAEITLTEVDVQAAYDAAYAAGREAAESEYQSAVESARAQSEATVLKLQEMERQLSAEVETALPELIVEGVRRIIEGWEPEPEQVEVLVRDLLAGLEGETGPLSVYLSPRDKERMLALHEDLERDFPGVSIQEDSKLRSGECLARGRFGVTDGRFETRLASLRKVFQ